MEAGAWLDVAATAPRGKLSRAREEFLRLHAEEVYAELTDDLATPLRIEELVERAAERFPGLAPTREELAAERERPLAEKEGAEIAQGLLLAHVLASPRAGAHLVWAMLRPTAEALEDLPELQASGEVDLGAALVRREGAAGVVEMRNPRHLNRRGRHHAGRDRGRRRPRAARPRGRDLRAARRRRRPPALRGAADPRRRHQPHPPLPRPGLLPLLRRPRPRLREQDLPRALRP
jgi:hypothetical protein